uniref:Uncharacterized protein n=1 Tax=Aegilops tauschii subsp. strangulata TaxID=200361 RepID=A0A453Q2J2_AEGTS
RDTRKEESQSRTLAASLFQIDLSCRRRTMAVAALRNLAAKIRIPGPAALRASPAPGPLAISHSTPPKVCSVRLPHRAQVNHQFILLRRARTLPICFVINVCMRMVHQSIGSSSLRFTQFRIFILRRSVPQVAPFANSGLAVASCCLFR